jgi:ornithine cyclodeaminase/alanine dehydrogenase-like protein (mu-crystallin family)
MTSSTRTRVLTRRDVRAVLDPRTCIDAVEHTFRLHAQGETFGLGILGTHVDGGGFHVKAAGITGARPYYAAKTNANRPGNPHAFGLPTIQGVIALYDATNGVPVALMDSIEITLLRTAAASAVAAKYLARHDARVMTIIGCGAQALPHARAMAEVRTLERIWAFDTNAAHASTFAQEASAALGIPVAVTSDFRSAARSSEIIVTCTPSRTPFLGVADVPEGAFVAAVGADNDEKQELATELMAASAVVVDVLDQCAEIGELHHALERGAMTRDDVRTDLAGLVSGVAARHSPKERAVFDSTGTALQDVAAAAVAYERSCERGIGLELSLSD